MNNIQSSWSSVSSELEHLSSLPVTTSGSSETLSLVSLDSETSSLSTSRGKSFLKINISKHLLFNKITQYFWLQMQY